VCLAVSAKTINHTATAIAEFDDRIRRICDVATNDIICGNRRKVAGNYPLFTHSGQAAVFGSLCSMKKPSSFA
jgi:hypothetical protein